MSAITSHSRSMPVSGMLDLQQFAGIAQRAFGAVRAWQRSMRQRRELLLLNDVELRELSLTAADVDREANKPFWQSVRLTRR